MTQRGRMTLHDRAVRYKQMKDALSELRAENERLQENVEIRDSQITTAMLRIERLRAKNRKLRALIARLVSETNGYKPYARWPLVDTWGCVHCGYHWGYDDAEHHADDCPVVLAREFMAKEG